MDETKKNEQIDYTKLVAAQNESKRRIKLAEIHHTLTEEQKKKRDFAIITGVCIVGTVAATYFSGIDPKQAIQTELQALNSFEALKEYLSNFTPAMWGGIITTAVSIEQYMKHVKKYNKANQEFYDMTDNEPTDFGEIVEKQAKGL